MPCDRLTCQGDLLSAGRWSKLLEHRMGSGRSREEREDCTCEWETEGSTDVLSSTQGSPLLWLIHVSHFFIDLHATRIYEEATVSALQLITDVNKIGPALAP